jgi:hypothetical protein
MHSATATNAALGAMSTKTIVLDTPDGSSLPVPLVVPTASPHPAVRSENHSNNGPPLSPSRLPRARPLRTHIRLRDRASPSQHKLLRVPRLQRDHRHRRPLAPHRLLRRHSHRRHLRKLRILHQRRRRHLRIRTSFPPSFACTIPHSRQILRLTEVCAA